MTYEDSDLDQIVLAYAITVHKSQGSEYPVVVMPITTQHFIMLQRNLLYTAVTRAKRMVVLVGTKKAVAIAVKNNKIETRNSLLRDFLQDTRSGVLGSCRCVEPKPPCGIYCEDNGRIYVGSSTILPWMPPISPARAFFPVVYFPTPSAYLAEWVKEKRPSF